MPAVGIGISPFFGGLTPSEAVAYYTRVKAGGGAIDDFSALVGLTLDYQRVASLNPSLYTFASGRKAGTQYSLIPTDGSGDFSVTRSGTTGMELNAQGYWQPVGENVPRYDYVSGVPMINIEEARTNLIARYKSFPHSDWTKSGASIQGDPNTAGADILAGWNFTVGFNTSSAVINDSNTFTTAAAGGLFKLSIITVGKFYLCRIKGDTSAVAFNLQTTIGGIIYQQLTGSFDIEFYFQAQLNQDIFLRNVTAGTTNIEIFRLQEVTGYASPFVDSSGVNLMSGYKLVATSNNGYIRLATAATVTAAATYTNSIWIKRVTGTGQAYIIDTNTTDRAITLTTDWQRFTYSAAAGTTSGQIGVKLAVSGDEVLIAHAQLEAGATASSPIGGAEGSSQTRNADAIVKTGASALIGQTEGVLYAEFIITKTYNATRMIFGVSDGTSSDNYIRLEVFNTNQLRVRSRAAASSSFVSTSSALLNIIGTHKIALAYKADSWAFYIDGNLIGSSTNNTVPICSEIYIGKITTTSSVDYFNDTIKLTSNHKTRLSNETLAALTTL